MTKFAKILKKNIIFIICAVLIAAYLIIRYTCGSFVAVSGPSMQPTFYDKDVLFCTIVDENTELHDGDIVIAQGKDETRFIVKRLAGVPGETIENEAVGIPQTQLGEDEYFLLGDNYEVSYDSRYVGTFSRSEIAFKFAGLHWTPAEIIFTVAIPAVLFLTMITIACVPGDNHHYMKIVIESDEESDENADEDNEHSDTDEDDTSTEDENNDGDGTDYFHMCHGLFNNNN